MMKMISSFGAVVMLSMSATATVATTGTASTASIASTVSTASTAAASTGSSGSPVQTCYDPLTLRVAFIPQRKELTVGGHYDVLIETLKDELGRNVDLVSVGSYGAVIEGLLDGSIDLAELGPGSYALARDRGTDIVPFASMYRGSDASRPAVYHSVLITLRDASVGSFEQLQGAAVSLVDPASTSGALVPRVAVQRATNMSLESWFGRVSFAGSHDLAIQAVINGRVDAAFVSDSSVREGQYRGKPVADALRIVWRSKPIPSDPFIYQARLCEPVKQAIQRVFFERQQDSQSLLAWRGMQGFVPVSDSDYGHLRFNFRSPDCSG